MQLNKKLGLAVASLLAASSPHAADWQLDGSVMSYQETDSEGQDRVSVVEPVVILTHQLDTDDFWRYTFAYDSLTGASPNGAHAASVSQEFPNFTVPAGLTPLDPGFSDQRLALGVTRGQPLSRMTRQEVTGNFSIERDYLSVGAGYAYFKDFDNKQTTLTLSTGFSYDLVNPKGGIKQEFGSIFDTTTSPSGRFVSTVAPFKEDDDDDDGEGEGGGENEDSLFDGKTKVTLEGLVGISHVLNRYTVLSANYSISRSSGYLTDPYKVISVVDEGGLPVDYLWEKRPDTRLRQTVLGSMVTAIGHDSLHLSYRYYWDDWGISTQTVDAKYHLNFSNHFSLIPHVRYSDQSRADFYRLSLQEGEPLPDYASSDYRLADMTTTTAGLKFRYNLADNKGFSLNIERIRQEGTSFPDQAIGDQRLHDLFPTVTMYVVTFGYRTEW
jgi:hypothetical protein